MMFNNSTNINKTNNHISPQLTEHKKRSLHMTSLEIHVQGWDRHKIRLCFGSPTFVFCNYCGGLVLSIIVYVLKSLRRIDVVSFDYIRLYCPHCISTSFVFACGRIYVVMSALYYHDGLVLILTISIV